MRVLVRETGGRPRDQVSCYQDGARAVEYSVRSRSPSHDQVGGIITRPQPQSGGHNYRTWGPKQGHGVQSKSGFPSKLDPSMSRLPPDSDQN